MHMKKLFGIVVGALLIAGGVIYALNVFGVADISFSLDGWWTLFIIIPCLSGLLSGNDKLGSFAGLCIGVLLLLAARDVFDFSLVWKLIVPVIIVVIGIKFIAKSLGTAKERPTTDNADNRNELVAVFTSQKANYGDKEMSAAKVGAIFGGAECNLKNAAIVDGCTIDVMCIFGGVDILLPENVIIKNNSFCLFGGISDKRAVQSADSERVTLVINGFCMFGGVDIK